MAGTSTEIVDANKRLAGDIQYKLKTVPTLPTECTIFKVPVNLRNVKESAYIPKMVSIGPLHHGEDKLNPMEAHKVRYLKSCLNLHNAHITLEDCVSKFRELESSVRNNYFEDQFSHEFSSDQFVTMMLLDSFFIIELFVLNYTKRVNEHDPMFNADSVYMNVYFDLMLLENQLPYFLLEDVYTLTHGYTGKTFYDLLVYYFNNHFNMDESTRMISPGYKLKHFVDYFLYCYSHGRSRQPQDDGRRTTLSLLSAAQLHEAGIKIKKCTSGCVLDIRFTNGVLEIPTLHFEDSTEHRLRNLVAMEQCCNVGTYYITDYVLLMHFLISTPRDVALLRSYGVIGNFLGSDEDVSRLINDIRKGLFRRTTDFCYYRLYEEMNAYCNEEMNAYNNRRRHRWRTTLKKEYFNNPWTVLSLIAAVILLICTIIQTVCSVISEKK